MTSHAAFKRFKESQTKLYPVMQEKAFINAIHGLTAVKLHQDLMHQLRIQVSCISQILKLQLGSVITRAHVHKLSISSRGCKDRVEIMTVQLSERELGIVMSRQIVILSLLLLQHAWGCIYGLSKSCMQQSELTQL